MKLLHVFSFLVLLVCVFIGVQLSLSKHEPQSFKYSNDPEALNMKGWLHLIPYTAPGVTIQGDDFVIDSIGTIYSGTVDGTIVFVDPKTDNLDLFLDLKKSFTKSSPIGLGLSLFHGKQYLIVADAANGVLRIDLITKHVEVLVSKDEINLPNDLAVSKKDPSIFYFTDSTEMELGEFDYLSVLWKDYLLANPSGRVWRYNQETAELKLINSGLWFPKGIALNHEEDALFVSNSLSCDIIEIPITSDSAGFSFLVENLSFHPAGLLYTSNSSLIVTSFLPRQRNFENYVQPYALLKSILIEIPFNWMQFFLFKSNQMREFNLEGSGYTIRTWGHTEKNSEIEYVTAVKEHKGLYFFGSAGSPPLAFAPSKFL